MNPLKNIITKPLFFGFLLWIILPLIALIFSHSQISTYSMLSKLQDGNGICFSRVVQTFTAKMLGKISSSYLKPDFIQMTGGCYKDIFDNFHHGLEKNFPTLAEQMTRITSKSHWFHEKLDTKIINLTGNTRPNNLINLENHFIKIEALNDEMNQTTESQKDEILSTINLSYMIFLTLFLLAAILLFIPLIKALRGYTSPVKSKDREYDTQESHLEENSPSPLTEPTLLSEIIEEALLALKRKICQHGIYVNTHIAKDLPISHQENSLFQVIYNILTSQIEILAKEIKNPKILIQTEFKGEDVILSLSHNGPLHLPLQEPSTGEAHQLITKELLKKLQWRYSYSSQ